jgi:hypothetical protein
MQASESTTREVQGYRKPYVCMHMCIFMLCMNAFYIYMYICIYVCMYVCMYVGFDVPCIGIAAASAKRIGLKRRLVLGHAQLSQVEQFGFIVC